MDYSETNANAISIYSFFIYYKVKPLDSTIIPIGIPNAQSFMLRNP